MNIIYKKKKVFYSVDNFSFCKIVSLEYLQIFKNHSKGLISFVQYVVNKEFLNPFDTMTLVKMVLLHTG